MPEFKKVEGSTNLEIALEGDDVLLRFNASEDAINGGNISASGKNLTFAKTGGNVKIQLPDGRSFSMGLNAYAKHGQRVVTL